MLSERAIRDWASRLVASESDADPPDAGTEVATLRVYEKLRRQLHAPVGADGFRALASRALFLAKSHSPGLDGVQITASGSLGGFRDVESHAGTDTEEEVGIVLIAQLLGLLLTLLGEAATVHLVETLPLRLADNADSGIAETSIPAADTNYFGPFDNILLEADQLRHVSERLEHLADNHRGIEEVMVVAGTIRNIAAVLDVFTVIRSTSGSTTENPLGSQRNRYLN